MAPQALGSLCALQGMSREVPAGMIGALGHPAGRPAALRSQNLSVTQSFSSPEYGGCILLCKKLSPQELWNQESVLKMHIPRVQVPRDSIWEEAQELGNWETLEIVRQAWENELEFNLRLNLHLCKMGILSFLL